MISLLSSNVELRSRGAFSFSFEIAASDSAVPRWAVVCGSNPLRQSRRGRV